MAEQSRTVQIASDPVIKKPKGKAGAAPPVPFVYTDEEQKEKDETDVILAVREEYAQARISKEKEWTESYRMYMSFIDTSKNPFLSNLFIPKTHEAVELLSAFLIGTNQSISATPENTGDSYKATVAGKWLDFMWRKVLKARLRILTWVKQGIVFGNGVVKVGWDADGKKTFLVNTAIEDIFFDFFVADIQDSEWIIHEVRVNKDIVAKDKRYDAKDAEEHLLRENVVTGGESAYSKDTTFRFATYDKAIMQTHSKDKVVIVEAWSKTTNRLISLAPTAEGWRKLRDVENPNYYDNGNGKNLPFRPFVKLRFKISPLSNRAYDTGAVYPTVKIQKAFNGLMNQYFDNVVLINNAMWKKKRGARINPKELVRRPGGVITMNDPEKDLISDSPADIKTSVIEMLGRLDAEFQQASMVVNLLKGIESGREKTATESALGQQNVQTLLDMIDENIADAMSELGDMLLTISLQNAEGNQTVKMFENDNQTGVLEFNPKNINGRYDLQIRPDRSAGTSKVVRQKQLLDFLKITSANEVIQQRFPNLVRKTLEKWLEEAGFSDTEFFFEEPAGGQPALPPATTPAAPTVPSPRTGQGLTPAANLRGAGAAPGTPTA